MEQISATEALIPPEIPVACGGPTQQQVVKYYTAQEGPTPEQGKNVRREEQQRETAMNSPQLPFPKENNLSTFH